MEVVLTGLWVKGSSSLTVLADSTLGAMEGLERTVAREDLEPLSEALLDTAELEALESREGGRGCSGKLGARGDCRRDEGRETTTGEVAATAEGLLTSLEEALAGSFCLSRDSADVSLELLLLVGTALAPTEAFKRL